MNNNGYYQSGNYQNPTIVPQQGTMPSQNAGLPIYNNSMMNNQNHVDYADNIFLLNVGKYVTVYFSYPDSVEWRDKVFSGTIEDAGRDYLLLRDERGNSLLLWLIYINYAVFDGSIIHNYGNR